MLWTVLEELSNLLDMELVMLLTLSSMVFRKQRDQLDRALRDGVKKGVKATSDGAKEAVDAVKKA